MTAPAAPILGQHEFTVEKIARIAHGINRGLCEELGEQSRDWDEVKESLKAGVIAIVTHQVTTPADSHIAWFNHHAREGWRYGPKKDPDKKEHPCMVAFDQLPPEQQLKDYLFFNAVTVLAFR